MVQSVAPTTASDARFLDTDQWVESVEGGALSRSMVLKFVDAGTPPSPAGTQTAIGSGAPSTLAVRYSTDCGVTWSQQTIGTSHSFSMDGVTIRLRDATPIVLSDTTTTNTADGRTIENPQGTMLYVMPSATYLGDTENQAAVRVDSGTSWSLSTVGNFERSVHVRNITQSTSGGETFFHYEYSYGDSGVWIGSGSNVVDPADPRIALPDGSIRINGPAPDASLSFTVMAGATPVYQTGSGAGGSLNAWGEGNFDENTVVRIDADASLASNVSYSYSLDGGVSWTTGQTGRDGVLLLPGGSLNLQGLSASNVSTGQQFLLHPKKAKVNLEISTNSAIQINNIGSTIFGGKYQGATAPVMADDESRNIFVTLGKLVGYLENDSQSGAQQCVADLRNCIDNAMVAAADVGARENRLTITASVISQRILTKEQSLSDVEDVDVAELMTQLAQQQIIYESVLKSSSTIMRMSLINYI